MQTRVKFRSIIGQVVTYKYKEVSLQYLLWQSESSWNSLLRRQSTSTIEEQSGGQTENPNDIREEGAQSNSLLHRSESGLKLISVRREEAKKNLPLMRKRRERKGLPCPRSDCEVNQLTNYRSIFTCKHFIVWHIYRSFNNHNRSLELMRIWKATVFKAGKSRIKRSSPFSPFLLQHASDYPSLTRSKSARAFLSFKNCKCWVKIITC